MISDRKSTYSIMSISIYSHFFFILPSLGIIVWIVMFLLIGDTVAPGGNLFGLVVLVVASHIGGFFMSLTTLPRLIGMLLTGIIMQVSGN